jgi:hypothetical protein
MSLDLRVIVDAAGRTILGEHEKETKDNIVLKNPATLFIQPNQQTGQLAVQLIPFFFREFVEESSRPDGLCWTFNKAGTCYTDKFNLDERLYSQYEKMMTKEANSNPATVEEFEGAAGKRAKEVKLFDEKQAAEEAQVDEQKE